MAVVEDLPLGFCLMLGPHVVVGEVGLQDPRYLQLCSGETGEVEVGARPPRPPQLWLDSAESIRAHHLHQDTPVQIQAPHLGEFPMPNCHSRHKLRVLGL